MHRFFLRVIIYICSLYLFIVFGESHIVLGLPITKDSKPDKKKIVQNQKRDPILVPPPPPDQPSLLDWSNLSLMPESFNLLNEAELKEKLERLKADIEAAKSTVDENNGELEECKKRADRFISLYSEGVVSHNELEVAKKNVSKKERSLQEAKGKLEDLNVQQNAILRRLASLKKTSKVRQYSSKKKFINSEKQKQ